MAFPNLPRVKGADTDKLDKYAPVISYTKGYVSIPSPIDQNQVPKGVTFVLILIVIAYPLKELKINTMNIKNFKDVFIWFHLLTITFKGCENDS